MNHFALIWSICLFVENHVREETSLEALACKTGFSPAYMRDVFHKYTGKTLSRYVQERKIANAAQELLHTNSPIVEVAVRYGYSGRTVFSRAFRRYTGYTPSAFRLERPTLARVKLCAGLFGAALPQKEKREELRMENKNTAVLYGVPKVAYGEKGCTPLPMCIQACAEYLGVPTDCTQAMAESGAAFRLVWNTACWDGGNVNVIFTFDAPEKIFLCGMRAMGRGLKMLRRTSGTKKEDFISFIRKEIDAGNPVIALGVIGPPEACLITGYRDGGNSLMGWNVFQEYPEYQTAVQFEENGYFLTSAWWENPDTLALIASGAESAPAFTPKETLQNAVEALSGRMCGDLAKGTLAYDAWKNALLSEDAFPQEAVLPILVERMTCHGDAMDCLLDGRQNAAEYLRRLAAKHPAQAKKLNAAAQAFQRIAGVIQNEMIPALGGWERGERQARRLAEPETRRLFAGLIDRMKSYDGQALSLLQELIAEI